MLHPSNFLLCYNVTSILHYLRNEFKAIEFLAYQPHLNPWNRCFKGCLV